MKLLQLCREFLNLFNVGGMWSNRQKSDLVVCNAFDIKNLRIPISICAFSKWRLSTLEGAIFWKQQQPATAKVILLCGQFVTSAAAAETGKMQQFPVLLTWYLSLLNLILYQGGQLLARVPNLARVHYYPARERDLGNEIFPPSNEKVNNLQVADEARCPFLHFRLLTIHYLI